MKNAGINYDRNLRLADISKAIRKALKEEFADYKFSVTSDRSSLSWSLTIEVKELPEYVTALVPCPERGEYAVAYTPQFEAAIKGMNAIAHSYNYDHSDSMSDYCDVNYFAHVQMDFDLRHGLIAELQTVKQ